MNPIHRSSASLSMIACTPDDGRFELDELLCQACRGDESAADVVVYELRPLLMMEVLSQLDGYDQRDADAIVDRVLEAVVEGRIWAKRKPGETLSTVVRLAGVFARRHLREERDDRF